MSPQISKFTRKNNNTKKTKINKFPLTFSLIFIMVWLIMDWKNKNVKPKFTDAVVAVTYRCNSQCVMCDVWKKNPQIEKELKADYYSKLPQTIKNVNISGGEPFLRNDLKEIIKIINKTCHYPEIVISTNGLLPEVIGQQTKKILEVSKGNIGVAVSLDGLGEIHNKIRGINHAFRKAIDTIHTLKKIGIKKLKISFTASNLNINQLEKIYQLSKKLNVEFTLAAAHNSKILFGQNKKIIDIDELNKKLYWLTQKEIKSYSLKRWLRAYFTHGLICFLSTGKRILPDYSGIKSFYLDPYGNIFPSVVSDQKMGNIKEIKNFEEISRIEPNQIQPSWMICTSRTAIKSHWIKAGLWILKNKIKSNLIFL